MLKKLIFSMVLLSAFYCTAYALTTSEGKEIDIKPDYLTGDEKLSCEAILCLSSPHRPGECGPSLSRYYGIHKKKWKDTVKARKNFLKMCPHGSADPNMETLVSSLSRAAGQCDVDALNARGRWVEKSEYVSDSRNQCTSGQSIRATARSGRQYSVTYRWENDDDGWSRGRCVRDTRYWQVDTSTPGECTTLWNHLYTDFEERPHVVGGSNPWDYAWIE